MCLGVPGKVLEVQGQVATVDFWGVRKQVRLDVLDTPVTAGDYILNHIGYAIRRIPADEGLATLKLYQDLLRTQAQEDELMAAEVRAEIEARAPGWWRNCDSRF